VQQARIRESMADRPLMFGLSANTTAMFVMFLAAMDSFATILWMRSGQGEEVNPVMRYATEEWGYVGFLFAKLLITGFCMLWVIYRAKPHHARIAALVALTIYTPVVGIHIFNGFHYL